MFKGLIGLAISLLRPDRSDNLRGQATRQIVSGLLATLADLAVFKLGLVLGLKVLVSALVSAAVATVVNFMFTRHFVFGQVERQRKGPWTQFALYVPTVLVSVALTQLILSVFSLWLGLDPMLVKVAAVPVVYVWTVFSGKYFVFDKEPLGGK
ncbi:MAG: GtrA family protein [Deltaproteobacteria bacterium]|jgi:putative flippase GtrA|nr:GtrA family protein [Deltaproteobacteria bacterium]